MVEALDLILECPHQNQPHQICNWRYSVNQVGGKRCQHFVPRKYMPNSTVPHKEYKGATLHFQRASLEQDL